MPLLGAHLSVAGGYYKAVDAAAALHMDAVQIFTKNSNQWKAKPLGGDETTRFRESLRAHRIAHTLSHASYLINLASPDEALRRKSVEAMIVELQRAAALGIPSVVLHPGSFTTSDEAAGLHQVVQSMREVLAATAGDGGDCLLENTAGQGTNLGWRLEHLAELLSGIGDPRRVGVCLDTCHLHAAGYPLSTPQEYQQTLSEVERVIGLKWVRALHLNDSQTKLGSRRDRHAHIGRGTIGEQGFASIVRDPRLQHVPMILETPKGTELGEDFDAINLATLRRLAGEAE